jgi:hypothetical protein
MRFLLATLLLACRSTSSNATPPTADSEHRGIAIAPVVSEGPSIAPAIGSTRGPRVAATGSADVMSDEEIRALMETLRDAAH